MFNILSGFSLLLLLATVGLWVRSYWYVDQFDLGAWKDRPQLRLTMNTVYTTRGSVLIMIEHLQFLDEPRSPNTVRQYFAYKFWGVTLSTNARFGYENPPSAAEEQQMSTLLGFGVKQIPMFFLWNRTAEKSATYFLLPFWVVAIGTALLPVLWGIRFQRCRSRRRLGACMQCGYDLRMHQPGQNCPECGTMIPVSKKIFTDSRPRRLEEPEPR
ncbi:MAG: hypothetical protein WCI73_07630 [Phycisphaerae bacterium]